MFDFSTTDVKDPKFRHDWVRLSRSENVGPATFWTLLKVYGTPETALKRLTKIRTVCVGGSKPIRVVSSDSITKELSDADRNGARLVLACDPEYPKRLLNIHGIPPVTVVKGDVSLLSRECVAIVGTRQASYDGCNVTKKIAKDLAEYGYVVVSGMARGIDAYAHYGSMSKGTVAILAGGVDHIYPKENSKLYHELCEKGAVMSEVPIGTPPVTSSFPQRNRIISGMSEAIVVVEAAKKSGSLITARLALEQGREVMAVPGSPSDPRCNGTNYLIKNGASLIENADDVVDVLRSIPKPDMLREEYKGIPYSEIPDIPSDDEISKHKSSVFEKLSHTPVSMEDIIKHSGIPIRVLDIVLVELELEGRITIEYGNKVVLR